MGHVTPSISLYNKAKQSKTMMLCSASRRRALGSRGLTGAVRLNAHQGMLARAGLGSLEVRVGRRAVPPLGPLPSPHLEADDHKAQEEGGATGGMALGSLRHREEVDGSLF